MDQNEFMDAIRNFKKESVNYDKPEALFADFQQKYNRTYATDSEKQVRYNIFKTNLRKVNHLNKLSPKTQYGITKFMDLTPIEFKEKYLMSKDVLLNQHPANNGAVDIEKPKNVPVPSSFDWRSRGVVTPVYNQGDCGSCWAFSATENIESIWAIAGHGLHELSPQQIVDCCNEAEYGCNGGYPYVAYDCVHRDGGLDYMKDYPYRARDGKCDFHAAWIGGKVASWSYVTRDRNEAEMLDYLVAHGPLSACVDAANWMYYNGGVVPPNACGRTLDHCILLTGYDLAVNPKYWVVRNSWGTDWGPYGGYIALEYGGNTCGMADLVTTAHA